MATTTPSFHFRDHALPTDRKSVREIVESTRFFHDYEVDVAVELIDERLQRGADSGYHFVFAEGNGETIGYACYGPIACTASSYDLYWIAVHGNQQRSGLGKALMMEVERRVLQAGGTRLYIETSGQPQYASTRCFYERCGCWEEAVLRDFYAPGDDKHLYVKVLSAVETE